MDLPAEIRFEILRLAHEPSDRCITERFGPPTIARRSVSPPNATLEKMIRNAGSHVASPVSRQYYQEAKTIAMKEPAHGFVVCCGRCFSQFRQNGEDADEIVKGLDTLRVSHKPLYGKSMEEMHKRYLLKSSKNIAVKCGTKDTHMEIKHDRQSGWTMFERKQGPAPMGKVVNRP